MEWYFCKSVDAERDGMDAYCATQPPSTTTSLPVT